MSDQGRSRDQRQERDSYFLLDDELRRNLDINEPLLPFQRSDISGIGQAQNFNDLRQ